MFVCVCVRVCLCPFARAERQECSAAHICVAWKVLIYVIWLDSWAQLRGFKSFGNHLPTPPGKMDYATTISFSIRSSPCHRLCAKIGSPSLGGSAYLSLHKGCVHMFSISGGLIDLTCLGNDDVPAHPQNTSAFCMSIRPAD